jgi:Lrp/AsnC family transcriptional regulator
VNVFASVRLKQHDEETLEALERAAGERPEILECFSMTGESDYLFRIVVRSIEDYEQFLKKVLLHLPGVASVNSSFALKRVKLTTNLPI